MLFDEIAQVMSERPIPGNGTKNGTEPGEGEKDGSGDAL